MRSKNGFTFACCSHPRLLRLRHVHCHVDSSCNEERTGAANDEGQLPALRKAHSTLKIEEKIEAEREREEREIENRERERQR